MASLADLQRAPGAPPHRGPAELPLATKRVRTFDTPEFAGMTFLEVEAKTALNQVRGMPFGWSINPYRGCSHACSYCLSGETRILMGNGRTKPLADVRPGDDIYGTVADGACRRYVVTQVIDHWSTVKPAYRIVLEDGTALIASGNHRFLTRRGWRHVTGFARGRARRPHLTLNDWLIGTGRFATAPKLTDDYQRGYLCGLIGGDGHLGAHVRTNETHDRDYRFRHARIDDEATSLTAWPERRSDSWAKGFLAGIFDAEGSCSGGILRIVDADERTVQLITSCLRRFGFRFVVETRPGGSKGVRVGDGVREHLRFLLLTNPASTPKCSFEGLPVDSDARLRVVAIEPLGFRLPLFDLATGTGDFVADGVISHNCFARPTHAYLNLSPLGDFERTIVVKTNVAEVLRRELARSSWRGEHVAMGTNTDNYQRAEGRYRLMPPIITALTEALTPFSVLTKGTLIVRDIPLLVAAVEQVPVTAAFTIGMLDEALWRDAEPGTPSPVARLTAVRTLNDAGIPTGIMLAPILPGLNDDREQLAALIDAAVHTGATHITPIVLHLRPKVREVFWPWLTEHHPELVQRYAALYRGSQAAAAYKKRIEAFVTAQRRAAWARYGRPPPVQQPRWQRPEQARTADARPAQQKAAGGHQLSLLDSAGARGRG